jgi:hypothetical protein
MPFTISDPKAFSSSTLRKRTPDGSIQEDADSIEACAGSMLMAIETKNAAELAKAFRKAFEMLEQEPHAEASHDESESQE